MKVLNVGSLNIDHTYQLERIVAPGETITSKQMSVYAGGKGLNQSIAIARAGIEVYHAGKIGIDGQFLIELCNDSGVNSTFIETGVIPTGNAIIQVTSQGQNSIILTRMKNLYPQAKVVLTLGQDGVYFQDKEQRVYQPARTVKAVDTTGAGDTFTGYYIAAVIEGKSAIEALTFATNAAALAVMKAGAANAIPKRHDVEKY